MAPSPKMDNNNSNSVRQHDYEVNRTKSIVQHSTATNNPIADMGYSPKLIMKNGKNNFPFKAVDELDIKIIDELLNNADVTSTEMSEKLKIPLSTIQRRRMDLESIKALQHKYELNPLPFGLRPVQFWVLVEKGKAEYLARHIFEKYQNVMRVTVQINTISNVGVYAYVTNSSQMFQMLEELKSTPDVQKVDYAEVVSVIDERSTNFFKIIYGLDRIGGDGEEGRSIMDDADNNSTSKQQHSIKR